MIDPTRLARGIWLRVQPISGGYLVRGGTADHVVEVDGGRVTCHCPDAERMGDGCKHSLASLSGYRRQENRATPDRLTRDSESLAAVAATRLTLVNRQDRSLDLLGW